MTGVPAHWDIFNFLRTYAQTHGIAENTRAKTAVKNPLSASEERETAAEPRVGQKIASSAASPPHTHKRSLAQVLHRGLRSHVRAVAVVAHALLLHVQLIALMISVI